MPKHTPREIVEECKLRWEVSISNLLDGVEELTAEDQNEIYRELYELGQQIEASQTILDEFDKEGVNMIIVNYKSKRELKKAVGKPLKHYENGKLVSPFFVTNINGTFKAVVTMADGKIVEVR